MRKSIHDEEWVSVKFDKNKSEKDEAKNKAKWVEMEQKQNQLTKEDGNKFE